MTASVLETRALAVGYSERVLLAGLDLDLPPGRLTCLLGPNGSGKTTLLRTLTGMLAPRAGTVALMGDDLGRLSAHERARRLSVVLTGTVDAGLLRAVDLVALGRHPHTGWSGRLRASDHAAVGWALDVTGAAPLAHRRVATLSDGERQRVLIARALAQEPTLLALDEPTAFVDLPRRAELGDLLGHLARECNLAVLMTTHDLDLALRVADDVWLLGPAEDHTAGGVRTGAPEDLALDGSVGRAFTSDEVVFDLDEARFVGVTPALATGSVRGSGPRAVWAARALQRVGLALVGARADADVEVTDLGASWQLEWAGGSAEHVLLGALAEDVRNLLPRLAEPPGAIRGQAPGSSPAPR